MTREQEIRERLERATQGEWVAEHDTCDRCRQDGTEEWDIYEIPEGEHARFERREDAEFIAHAPADLLYLLDRVAELERVLVAAMIPLEAINASVKWELADSVKVSVKEAVESGRKAVFQAAEEGR